MSTNIPANEQGLVPDPVPSATHTEEPASTGASTPRQRRGFAVMDKEKVREMASRGGKAAHAAGTAHQFTSDEARAAGRKGGLATHARRTADPTSRE